MAHVILNQGIPDDNPLAKTVNINLKGAIIWQKKHM